VRSEGRTVAPPKRCSSRVDFAASRGMARADAAPPPNFLRKRRAIANARQGFFEPFPARALASIGAWGYAEEPA